MNLKVRIHDKEYEIAQGATFSEEYNETLDSGAIRIPHVIGQIDNLRPYDDVYIYDSEYNFDEHILEWRQGGEYSDNPFYRHLLVNQYTEEVVNLDTIDPETNKTGIFSYSIELFSETKGLEMVQVPNCSVTQPLNINKKTDIYTYLCRFVDRYSPKYKTIDRQSFDKRRWTYAKKYSVSPELKEIFGGVYSQDFTLSNPTLRDVLSTLMITKDMIPYVKDNVIYAKDITKRTDTYNIESQKKQGKINLVVGQMSSADYCDGVRRQYSDALSQDGTCNFIEYLGFRNKDNALMTLDNMQVETTHKIYKIKKFYMCYYKKAFVYINGEKAPKEAWMLCKQDITPLIRVNSDWGILPQDWREIKETPPKNVYDMSKYKLTTVSYDIGGSSISGWGTRYNEYNETELSVYDITKTYIENIFSMVDSFTPFGESSEEQLKAYYKKHYAPELTEPFAIVPSSTSKVSSNGITTNVLSHVFAPEEVVDSVLKFKTFFFEIEYSGFYDGALIHSRDKGNDNLFQNDNQSSSLTLLEKDGFSQKEKLNRFANKTYTMKGRLDGSNYGVDKLLKLGQTGVISENDDDVIIYRREYSIYDNYILVSYAGVQDYVLKNFYTSVYAKYRTNQLMPYGESTNRAETEKVMFVFSKNKKYKDDEDTFLKIENNDGDITSSVLFSAFTPNSINKSINNGIILIGNDNLKYTRDYGVDVQSFNSGNSLCFNIAMVDNVSGGNYVEKWSTDYEILMNQPSEDKDYYVGSSQRWLSIVDDKETGEVEEMGFDFSHVDRTLSLLSQVSDTTDVEKVYLYSKMLPKRTNYLDSTISNKITLPRISLNKDNKDKINMTLQIEPISADINNVLFSEYLMKLSDLVSSNKYDEDVEIYSVGNINTLPKRRYIFRTFVYALSNVGAVTMKQNPISNDNFSVDDLIQEINNTDGKVLPFKAEILFRLSSELVFSFNATYITILEDDRELADENHPYKVRLLGYGVQPNGSFISSLDFLYGYNETIKEYCYEARIELKSASKESKEAEFHGAVVEYKQKKSTIAKNMFVEFSNHKINRTTTTEILPNGTSLNRFSSYKPSYVFNVMGDGEDSYIRVRLRDGENYNGELLSGIDDYTQSINYWYFDFDSSYSKDYSNSDYVFDYKPDESGYHFVFGVNITPSDKNRGYVDIYITKTTHRDKRVFDSIGRQVGITHNCVTENEDGEMVYTTPDGQEYDNLEHNVPLYMISTSIKPDRSGKIVGNGMYYKGEKATIEFIPNDGNVFSRWKENGEIIKSNPISFVVDKDRSFIAQCEAKYHIWKDNLGVGPLTTNESDVELYKVNREEIDGDILEISAINLEVTTTGAIPLPYFGSFSIDPAVNVSKDTASKAIVLLDAGTITLKTWFENDKIMFNGYRTYLGEKQAIVVNAPILNIILDDNNPKYGTITLDFSDENISTISYECYVETDAPGVSNLYSGTISRDQATDNKYIIENVPYGSKVNLWATTSDIQNYIPVYSKEEPKSSVLGFIIIFKPKSKQITRKTLWESTDGIELTYGYDTSGILQLPRTVVLDGLENYLDSGESKSTQYMQFVFDVDGNEKSIIIDHDANPIAISDGITFESLRLFGVIMDKDSGVVDTALFYVLLTTGTTQPVIKLKKVLAPSV